MSGARMISAGSAVSRGLGRVLALALALGWVHLENSSQAFAEVPDGGASARPDAAPWPCSSLDTCLAAVKALPSDGAPDEMNVIDGLAPTDLPPLLRALDAGERRVAPAVATIGTPEAIAALYSALKARPQ